jgi:hypothetical protein
VPVHTSGSGGWIVFAVLGVAVVAFIIAMVIKAKNTKREGFPSQSQVPGQPGFPPPPQPFHQPPQGFPQQPGYPPPSQGQRRHAAQGYPQQQQVPPGPPPRGW